MSIAFASSLLLLCGALLIVADREGRFALPARVLMGLGALGIVPSALSDGQAAFGAATVAIALCSPFSGLVAASLCATPGSSDPGAFATGVAVALGAVALERHVARREAEGRSPFEGGALTALAAFCLLLCVDRGAVLRWSVSLGVGDDRVALPGLGLLLGLVVLVALFTGLLLAAAAASGTAEGSRAPRLGAKGLVLGAGLGSVTLGVLAVEGWRLGEDVLRSSRGTVMGVVLSCALLLAGGVRVLRGVSRAREARETSVAWATLGVCALALLLAGWGALGTEGTYAEPRTALLGATVLVALAGALAPVLLLRLLTVGMLLLALA